MLLSTHPAGLRKLMTGRCFLRYHTKQRIYPGPYNLLLFDRSPGTQALVLDPQAVLDGAGAVFPQLAGVGSWILAGHSMVRRA